MSAKTNLNDQFNSQQAKFNPDRPTSTEIVSPFHNQATSQSRSDYVILTSLVGKLNLERYGKDFGGGLMKG